MTPDLAEQVRVSKMLGTGFVLSLVGVAGLGSFIAFILGLRALRMINRSNGKLSGRFMAWWCIVLGGLGTVTLPLALTMIVRSLK
jgi:hypothetical protein